MIHARLGGGAVALRQCLHTGLRKGELASVAVSQAELDGPVPYFVLYAKDEKNRKGSKVPLRADTAA